jgi:multiple sugar transport system ATP-binding protein
MRVEIAKLHNDLGNTMIYVTHDQVEAMTMADKIVVLNAGVIEQVGAPLELYNNPRNRFVAGFLGSPKMNFLESTVAKVEGTAATVNVGGTMFTLRQQVLERPKDDKVIFGIRPEHMGITEAAGTKLADVRVELVEHLGDQTMLYASTKGGQPLTIALSGQQHIESGSTVTAYVDPSKYHAFNEDGRAL